MRKPGRWRRRMRMAALAAAMTVAAACQPGDGGQLDPVAGQPAGAPGPNGGGSVSLIATGVEAQISGRWSTRLDANSFELQAIYRNIGARSILLDAARFHAMRGRDRGDVLQVVDMTGVNAVDDRDDNDDAKDILNAFENRPAGTIRIAPGEQRHLTATAALPDGVAPLDDGQAITIVVPMAHGTSEARFTAGGSWP